MLIVQGDLDIATGPELREALGALVEDGRSRIVVDLSPVGFMDSSGLGVLVDVHKRLRQSGDELVLVCDEGPVLRVLGITGLDKVLAVHGDLQEVIG